MQLVCSHKIRRLNHSAERHVLADFRGCPVKREYEVCSE